MPHYKDKSGGLHFLDDAAFAYLLPEGCEEITNEEAAALAPKPDLAAEVRAARVPLLAAADIAINIAEDAGRDATAWRIYRQALRDVTTQSGFPKTVKWPAVPA